MKKSYKARLFSLLVLIVAFSPILAGYIANFPSDVIPFFAEWRITMGDGSSESNLIDFEHPDYFFDTNDGTTDWVVYKTPNSGGTTPNSSNTRSELRQKSEWTPETGGNLTATLKVMNVSTTSNAMVPAAFSCVVGQIHSDEGHENEPLKIYYKKFPGHTKGSVFWNYEINTEGSNSERWDFSTAVWGYDWSVVGTDSTTYPAEPADGIELNEEFSYEVNVYDGIMYLTFTSPGHPTKSFTKNLIVSEYTNYSDIPQQVLTVFASTGQDGTEKANAYAGELQYFKQGSYNQSNGKNPSDNMVWNTGAQTYNGNLADQYANGSYAEVWFKEATVGPAIVTGIGVDSDIEILKGFYLNQNYPNPFNPSTNITFSLPKESHVDLAIYDINGKLAQQLIDRPVEIGEHTVKFDASNLASGIYLYRIQTGSFTQMRRMILMK
ncbi:MAG: polysaccharide lyase family 7 protein [Calditrichia bacterium]